MESHHPDQGLAETGALVDKFLLRHRARERLRGMQVDERTRRSARIRQRLLVAPEWETAGGVLICLSFNGEVDTWPLVADLRARDHAGIFVPRMRPEGDDLSVHRYPCPLETLPFGLRQPADDSTLLPEEQIDGSIDLVCLVGLAFNPNTGVRLGYGGGFFDRFLRQHPQVTGVGIAYDWQLTEAIDGEHHDAPLDLIVSESAVHRIVRRRGERKVPLTTGRAQS